MIIMDSYSQASWGAVIGYDTLRFDVDFIDKTLNPDPPRDSVVVLMSKQNRPREIEYNPIKEVETSWNDSMIDQKKTSV